MSLFRSIVVPVSATVAIIAASAFTPASAAHSEAMNVARVRAHLDSVLNELSARHVDGLSNRQRARRASLLSTLRAYRDAGAFPHNYDFSDRAVPYFRDRKTGVLCAVGYLLDATGRRDIVDRVVATNNNVRVPQLSGDTALASWLHENGITLGEAARIQVVYVQSSRSDVANVAADIVTPAGALLGSFASVLNLTANARGQYAAPIAVGMVSGVAAIGVGVWLATEPNMSRAPGTAAIALGATNIVVATVALVRRHAGTAADANASEQQRAAKVSVAPVVEAAGRFGERPAAGAALSIRF